jgi:hypothetical protein
MFSVIGKHLKAAMPHSFYLVLIILPLQYNLLKYFPLSRQSVPSSQLFNQRLVLFWSTSKDDLVANMVWESLCSFLKPSLVSSKLSPARFGCTYIGRRM